MTVRHELAVAALARADFAPFGDVIEAAGEGIPINEGMAHRFHDLAAIDAGTGGGRLAVSVFRARPWPRPIQVRVMERHPLGSQAFVPMSERPFAVVVAPPGPAPKPEDLRAFVTNGRQGVHYRPGVWHHPLLVLDQPADVLVIDRVGPGVDRDVVSFLAHGIFLTL